MHSLRACSTEHMQAEWKTKDSQPVRAMWLCAHVLLTVRVDSAQLHFACKNVTADTCRFRNDFPRNLHVLRKVPPKSSVNR